MRVKLPKRSQWSQLSGEEVASLALRAEDALDDIEAEQSDLKDRCTQIMAKADAGDDLSERDQKRVDRLTASSKSLDDERRALEDFIAWADEMKPAKASGELVDGNGATPRAEAKPRTFAAMFAPNGAERHEWNGLGEFVGVVRARMNDPRLEAASKASSGEDGGFLIPERMLGDIFDLSLESEIVRPRARVVAMDSESVTINGLDLEDHSGSVLGGLKGEWLGEGQKGSKQKPKFRRIRMSAEKLMIYVDATSELAEDAPGFSDAVESQMAESTSFNLDEGFLWGSGVGRPLGIFNAGALITVPAIGSQTADTIVYQNLTTMASRLPPGSWNRAVWVASQTALPELMKLQFQQRTDAGALIADQAVSAPVFQINADGTYALMGRPLIFSEKMKELGELGDILLADFSAYAVGMRRQASIARSIEPGWDEDLVSFRIRLRATGQPLISQPITPANGATVSPFVTLGAR